MSSNNHEAIVLPGNFGFAHDYDPTVFPFARVKESSRLQKGKLYLAATQNEIRLAHDLFCKPSEWDEVFHGTREMLDV